jgi:hypothetical protein
MYHPKRLKNKDTISICSSGMQGVGVALTETGKKMYKVYEGLVWWWVASEANSLARASACSLAIAESLNAL